MRSMEAAQAASHLIGGAAEKRGISSPAQEGFPFARGCT